MSARFGSHSAATVGRGDQSNTERKVHKSRRGFQCAPRQVSHSRHVVDHSLVRGSPRHLALRYGIVGAGRVMLPPLVVIIATPLLLAAFGQSLSLFHVMGLVLLLAISVDYAIFFGEMQGRRSRVTMFGVLIAASTAQLSFGLLEF